MFADRVQKASNTRVHLNKRLVSVSKPGTASGCMHTPSHPAAGGEELQLHFRDGTTATCDVLVGADGIKSAVRDAMLDFAATDLGDDNLRTAAPAQWSGDCIYRSLIPMPRLREIYEQFGGTGDMAVSRGPTVVCDFSPYRPDLTGSLGSFVALGRRVELPSPNSAAADDSLCRAQSSILFRTAPSQTWL